LLDRLALQSGHRFEALVLLVCYVDSQSAHVTNSKKYHKPTLAHNWEWGHRFAVTAVNLAG
jgi:hypothetical protein